MIDNLIEKFKEALMSIMPIVLIVLLMSLTPLFNLTSNEKIVFSVASIFLIIGMALFSFGASVSMSNMGEYAGAGLVKTKRVPIILIVGFIMGFFVTIAEPDLIVLAEQLASAIDPLALILIVSIGVGVFIFIALLKTIYRKPLTTILLLFYMILFATTSLLTISKSHFVPLAFDSGGVTTGPVTVPFIMAFGVGVANTLGGKNRSENAFGFVSLCAIGPILAVILLLLFLKGDIKYTLDEYNINSIINYGLKDEIVYETKNVFTAVGLIFIMFMTVDLLFIKLPMKVVLKIFTGLIVTTVGLVIFLSAAAVGLMPIGFIIGKQIILKNQLSLYLFCFVVGMTVVVAEPAIHVLNQQVEDITGGTISKKSMLIALAIGVGIALLLSVIRILYDFSILIYLIPGYIIALALSIFVPPIYAAIAFDSGGVASGPISSTFILPLMIGACSTIRDENDILRLAFGVVSMITMIPLISIQLLGFKAIITKKFKETVSLNKIRLSDDNVIVYFEL